MEQEKWKNKSFWEAFLHSSKGIKIAFEQEHNLKIQLIIAIFAIILAIFFKLTTIEWLILSLTIGMVLFAEMVNTTIEIVLDLYSERYNEKIKIAKDIASGAVLVTAITAVVIGGILFLPKLGNIK